MIDEARDNLAQLAQALRPALSLGTEGGQSVISSELAKYAVHRHRVGPLLHLASNRQMHVEIEESARALIEAIFARNVIADLRQQATESTLRELLLKREVAFSFIKGRSLSSQLYGKQPARQAKDIDIIVDKAHIKVAIDALNKNGFVYRPYSLKGRKFAHMARQQQDAKIHKDLKFTDQAHSVQVELHQRLFAYEPKGFTRDFMDTLEDGIEPTLNNPHYCLYLFLHGAVSLWPRLKWVADLSLMVRKMTPTDLDQMISLSQRYGCFDAILGSARLVEEIFPGSLQEDWAMLLHDAGRNRRAGSLFGLFLKSLASPEIDRPKLPLRAFLSSGTADLVFPGRIAFVPSALNRLLGSLSIRF